jgi:hypothetical protein
MIIWLFRFCLLDSFQAIGGFAAHFQLHVYGEKGPKGRANVGIVINDEDGFHE